MSIACFIATGRPLASLPIAAFKLVSPGTSPTISVCSASRRSAAALSTAVHNRSPSVNEATTDPLLWRKTTDEFNGLPIVRIDVAAARPTGPPLSSTTATKLAAQLRSDAGVRGVTLVRTDAGAEINGYPEGLLACEQLSATPEIGRCESTARVAIMPLYSLDAGHTEPNTRWPAPTTGTTDLAALSVAAVVVATDKSDTTLERVRTTTQAIAPDELTVPRTVGQTSAATLRDVTQLQHLADLAVLLSVIIAGCSLAVAVAGSLLERRRPFALLRLTGMPLRSLRQIVLLEAAVPLIGLAVVSAAGGLLTAELLLRALRATTMRLPGTPYALTLLAGIVLALAVVMATMPLLRRISAPENARSE